MEKYYNDTLKNIKQDEWGTAYKQKDLNHKIIFSHQFKEWHIVPDGHYALEIISKAHETATEITELSKKVLQNANTLTGGTKWTNKLYSEGARFDYSDPSLL